MKGESIGSSQATVKQRTTLVDSVLMGDVGANMVGDRLRKRHNIDFLSGGSPDVIDILDDDTSWQSKGVDQGTTTPYQRPEKGNKRCSRFR